MELVAKEMVFADEGEQADRARRESRNADILRALGGDLFDETQKRRGARTDMEVRWLDDLAHYNSEYASDVKLDPRKSDLFLGWTRQYTNDAEAAFFDLLDPLDGKLWSLKPTPVAEIPPGMAEEDQAIDEKTGQPWVRAQDKAPLSWKDLHRIRQFEAEQRATRMEDVIADDLVECRANSVLRKMAHQAIVLGTGIIRGPIVHSSVKQAWQEKDDGEYELVYKQQLKPIISWIDLWHFFPDMAAQCVEDANLTMSRRLMYPFRLKQLANHPHYNAAAIHRVCESEPHAYNTGASDRYQDRMRLAGKMVLPNRSQYEVFSVEGPIESEQLLAYGYDPAFVEQLEGQAVWGDTTMVDGEVIRIAVSPLDRSGTTYSVWQWEEDETSIFGYGVPYRGRTPQKLANAAIRAMGDNLGYSAGPITILNDSVTSFSAGDTRVTGGAVFRNGDSTKSARDAAYFFQVNSIQPECRAIIEQAEGMMEDSIGQHKIEQGELGANGPRTLGATSIIANNASRNRRRAVKRWDDMVQVPLIQRFFDFHMQHNPDKSIKGDVEVEAKGATMLMVKETQLAAMHQFASLADHPLYGKYINPEAMLERIAQAQYLQRSDVLYSESEIEENEQKQQGNQQPSPEMIKLQNEREARDADYKIAQIEAQTRMMAAQIDREIAIIRAGTESELSQAQIEAKITESREKMAADIAKTQMIEQNKADLQMAEIALKMDPANPTNQGI